MRSLKPLICLVPPSQHLASSHHNHCKFIHDMEIFSPINFEQRFFQQRKSEEFFRSFFMQQNMEKKEKTTF